MVDVISEQLNGYERLNHAGPIVCEDFHSSLKTTIAKDEYEYF